MKYPPIRKSSPIQDCRAGQRRADTVRLVAGADPEPDEVGEPGRLVLRHALLVRRPTELIVIVHGGT